MIKSFIEPFFTESESKELKEYSEKFVKIIQDRNLAVIVCESAVGLYNKLKKSPLKDGETDQEREKQLKKLYNDAKKHKTRLLAIEKTLFVLKAQAESIETRAFSRYTEQNDNAVILKDCFEIIQAFEPDDVKKLDTDIQKTPPIIKFSYSLGYVVVGTYLNYFSEIKDTESSFKVLKAVYDRTLAFYPQGLSDRDIKNKFCIFSKSFFKALESTENQNFITVSKKQPKGFAKLEDTPTLQALQDVTKISKRIFENPNQISLFDNGRTVDLWNESENQSPNARTIAYTKKSKSRKEYKLTFAVEDYKTLLKGNANAHKFISLIAEKLLDIDRDANQNTRIVISIEEFANRLGVDTSNARKFLKTVKPLLSSIKFDSPNGYIYVFPRFIIGTGKTQFGNTIGVRGHITLDISSDIDMTLGGTFAKYLPLYAWELTQNAWFLAHYVYSTLRNDAKNTNKHIDKSGIYENDISLMKILPVLNLPHPTETARVEQLILEPIRKAVETINKAENKNNGYLHLAVITDTQKAPVDRVTEGYLKIILKPGDYLESLKSISQKRLNHKAESAKKTEEKEKRAESAKAREQARIEYREKKKQE